MPNHKHNKPRGKELDNCAVNSSVQPVNNNPAPVAVRRNDFQRNLFDCCAPFGCKNSDEKIDNRDPFNAVKVFCNNEHCQVGNWMHKDCFEEWETSVLAYLRSCGRARSWSEKQRLQNLWTKKGYDLAFKACDCKCGKGHLRKDLDFFPKLQPKVEEAKKPKKHKKKNDKPMPVMSTTHKTSIAATYANGVSNSSTSQAVTNLNYNMNANLNITTADHFTTINKSLEFGIHEHDDNGNSHVPRDDNGNSDHDSHHNPPVTAHNGTSLRQRTGSVSSHSSTGSSPPNSTTSCSPLSASPVNGNYFLKQLKKTEFFADSQQASTGNIFKRRIDFSAFNILPRFKQNPYNIKVEDEGAHGNDDTRSFVLSTLSSYKMTSLRCVLCKYNLPVFDHYPLLDGTLFLSPQSYDESVVQVIWEGRIQFLNSVCVGCLEGGTDIKCSACKQKWIGSSFVLGTMYTYDIFAAMPCCQKRLTCKYCRRAVVDVNSGLDFFSQYSQMIICPYCNANDYHFIRSLGETFTVKPICC